MILSAYVVPHPPIIIPEIGKGEEEKISKTIHAYHTIAKDIANKQPETIVIISPHAPSYLDYIHIASGQKAQGNFGKFHHPEIQMQATYDQAFVNKICYYTRRNHIDGGTRGEQTHTLDHGVMIIFTLSINIIRIMRLYISLYQAYLQRFMMNLDNVLRQPQRN